MNKKSILQIAETYMRMVQAPPYPIPPQDPPTEPSTPPPPDPGKPQIPPQDPSPAKPLPPVKNKKKKVNEKTSNPVFGIASTYQRLILRESIPPDLSPEEVMRLLAQEHAREQSLPVWTVNSNENGNISDIINDLNSLDQIPDSVDLPELDGRQIPPSLASRIEEILRQYNDLVNNSQNPGGRGKYIAAAVAALIAAGALAYLTYEELMQMVEDYFNPPVQVDVPQNFTPYISPYQQMINNLGSQQGGGIFGG